MSPGRRCSRSASSSTRRRVNSMLCISSPCSLDRCASWDDAAVSLLFCLFDARGSGSTPTSFLRGTKVLQVDMTVLLSDSRHQVLLEETTHPQQRKTVTNTSFASSSPTATHSKETCSFEHLDKCRQTLLDYSRLNPEARFLASEGRQGSL